MVIQRDLKNKFEKEKTQYEHYATTKALFTIQNNAYNNIDNIITISYNIKMVGLVTNTLEWPMSFEEVSH